MTDLNEAANDVVAAGTNELAPPPWLEVSASDDHETLTITLTMPRAQATSLASTFMVMADDVACTKRQAIDLRHIARWIRHAAKPPTDPARQRRGKGVLRPSGKYHSDIDVQHVVHGGAPFPVLSIPDMWRAHRLLEERGMPAGEIANRLHISERTVWRRRKKVREGMEKQ